MVFIADMLRVVLVNVLVDILRIVVVIPSVIMVVMPLAASGGCHQRGQGDQRRQGCFE
jgi:hypothetical protein